jgi:hypothetical protein
MSRAATRSAMCSGWLNPVGSSTTPWPIRIVSVCCAAAVRKISGEEQWENSVRKWCSTAHRYSNPTSSAFLTCSIAFQKVWYSWFSAHGRCCCSSYRTPNFIGSLLPATRVTLPAAERITGYEIRRRRARSVVVHSSCRRNAEHC